MIKHVYYRNVEGGYFYRMYPRLTNKQIEQPEPSLFPELRTYVKNPVPETVDKVSFHGIFLDKKVEHKKFFVALLSVAKIIFCDPVINETETRTLSSIVVIDVPENIFNYPYKLKEKYFITAESVAPI